MMIIILAIFITYIIWDTSTRYLLNPYKLIMVFGKKGSGKTTYLTKQAIRHIKKGWQVYSNIYIPGTYLFNINDIGVFRFPEKSLVIIDEVGMIWDNRDFKNFKNDVRDYFKLQRQYKNKVILTSQAFDIDKKLRDLTDQMILLTNFARCFSLCRYIIKRTGIANNESGQGPQGGSLVEVYKFALIPSFTFIPRWVHFFKSYNPKPLLDKTYIYNDFTPEQSKLKGEIEWYKHAFKSFLKRVANSFKSVLFLIISKVKSLLKLKLFNKGKKLNFKINKNKTHGGLLSKIKINKKTQ